MNISVERRLVRQVLTTRVASALLGLIALACAASAEEYHLQPGDVLKTMIVGAPELAQTVPIEMDGTAWFPLVGAVEAGGMTLKEIRDRVAGAYATMSIGRPIEPGGRLPQVIEQSEVHVTVAEYRPIYLTGDVAEPREIAYRPGLTLSQVMSLASSQAAVGQLPASPAEIEAAAVELAREYARIWRFKTFLGEDRAEDYDRIFVADLDAIDEIVGIEKSILAEKRETLAERRGHLQEEIRMTDVRLAVLERQKQNEAEGLQMDEEIVSNISGLFDRGLVPATRLAEVRRASLVTASRALQVDVAIEDARGRKAILQAEISVLDADARNVAWEDLGEAVTLAQVKRSRLATLVATGGTALQVDLLDLRPIGVITRNGVTLDGDSPTAAAIALQPGDIVEIRRIPRANSDS